MSSLSILNVFWLLGRVCPRYLKLIISSAGLYANKLASQFTVQMTFRLLSLDYRNVIRFGLLALIAILSALTISLVAASFGLVGQPVVNEWVDDLNQYMVGYVSSPLLVIALFSFAWIPYLALRRPKFLLTRLRIQDEVLPERDSEPERIGWLHPKRRNSLILLSIAILTIIYLTSIRNVSGGEITGYDAPYYIGRINEMKSISAEELSYFFVFNRFFLVIVPFFFLPTETIVRLLPVVFGVLLVAATYLLARRWLSYEGAAMAAIFASMSFLTLRMTADLFANLYAMSMGAFFFALALRDAGTTRWLPILGAGAIFAFLALTYPAALFVFFPIYAVVIALELVRTRKITRTLVRFASTMAPTGLVLLVIFSLATDLPDPYHLYLKYQPSVPIDTTRVLVSIRSDTFDLKFFSVSYLVSAAAGTPPFERQTATQENPLLWLLFLGGLIMVALTRKSWTSMLIIFTAVVSFVALVLAPAFPHRLLLYLIIPVSILSAFSVSRLSGFSFWKENRQKFVALIILFLLSTAVARVAYSDIFFSTAPPRPTVDALRWVAQNYYWRDTIVVINEDALPLFNGWVSGITLAHVFNGNLLNAMQDNPDLINRSIINSSEYHILVISNNSGDPNDPYAYYNPNSFERQMLTQVNDAVYEVKPSAFDLHDWEERYFARYVDFADSPGWQLGTGAAQNDEGIIFTQTFSPGYDTVVAEHGTEISTNEYPYLLVRMNIDQEVPYGRPYFVARVWYEDGTSSTLEHHMHFTHPHYALMELKRESVVERVDVMFTDYNVDVQSGTYAMKVDLLAFGSVN